ncbi:RagB/SusD family nutrient uptake outer membrane protein [Mucilaginibacter corticis]|uniref:RagB/SusD family nutrient uptake outer membrane protein n=1 Tax=Mucilaginibacter corticis TaxID=2597670 RepID=A0A556MT14_9SPHI|nr:RagB/SusD family nutrient uptake outer membrane protein [Mucilaginibacter corticis]TSJ43056.1 RagB/SusD family nutrient uptake outer membrane protein [Mucilaginibacter corticis]
MKKVIICLLVVMVASQYGCKKFLDLTPIDKLTGNNYFQSANDVEAFINDQYGRLYEKYVQTNTAGGTGEMRSGEVIPSSNTQTTDYWGGEFIDAALVGGHTRTVANSGLDVGPQTIANTAVDDYNLFLAATQNANYLGHPVRYQFYHLTQWSEYYQVIQSVNILISKLQEGIPALTSDQTKAYIAEAKFIRCYSYFFMVRLYGDVVYYTAAYQKDPLPRMNMVTVVNNCIADLEPSKNDLPVAINDPIKRGVRASRGAIIGLLMNMYMWNAGFDPANATKDYTKTAALGAELRNSGAFDLLPIAEWNTVTKGRSTESLFEFFSTVNYNNTSPVFQFAPNGVSFIHFPYKLPEYNSRASFCVFTTQYMQKLFPDVSDKRVSIWFESAYNQNAETFQMLKFAGNTNLDVTNDPNNQSNPDNTYLIMRYADALLLEAEAQSDLGNEEAAAIPLNKVRLRAEAQLWSGVGQGSDAGYATMGDAIFYERAKELIGEGTHYFDLVRTKRILSKKYTDNPLTRDKFDRGAWTWPIDPAVLSKNNPYMTLNQYWTSGRGL